MKVVKVEWVDSHSSEGWCYLTDEVRDIFPCTSVGFLLKDSKDCIKLSPTMSDNPDYCHTILTIPRCAIKSIKKV